MSITVLLQLESTEQVVLFPPHLHLIWFSLIGFALNAMVEVVWFKGTKQVTLS
jgi:hypothetical protein